MKTIMLLLVGTALTCFVYGCSEDTPLGSGGLQLTCTVTIQYSAFGAYSTIGRRQATGTARGSFHDAGSNAREAACGKLGAGIECVASAEIISEVCVPI